MNTYHKFAPNVFLAKCPERHEKGEIIAVTTKYGKENESIVYNLVFERDGFYFYSIVRADGFNAQERARRKAERYEDFASRAREKSNEYYDRSQRHADFLSLGEPIKVGHHSEAGHRRIIREANYNMGKSVEFDNKADAHREKAAYWDAKSEIVNLSTPESVAFFAEKLARATEYHSGLKTDKYERAHSYSLTYAKKAVNEAQKSYDLAVRLWGEP